MFALITAAQLAVIVLVPGLLALLAVYVVYSAAITAVLFVASAQDRRRRSSQAAGARLAHMPSVEAERRSRQGDEKGRHAA